MNPIEILHNVPPPARKPRGSAMFPDTRAALEKMKVNDSILIPSSEAKHAYQWFFVRGMKAARKKRPEMGMTQIWRLS